MSKLNITQENVYFVKKTSCFINVAPCSVVLDAETFKLEEAMSIKTHEKITPSKY